MDWQRVKEKVTEEVIRQLQKEAGAPAAAPAPQAPPALAPALPACEVGDDFATDLLIVVAGPVCDKVLALIRSQAAAQRVTVVAGAFSERLAEAQACGRLFCEGNEATARKLVKGAQTVIVPVITTSTAAKVAGLIGDCLASAVLVQAALAGKKAIIARESLDAPKDAAWNIRRKVEDVVSALRTLGFTVTDLSGIATELARAGSAASAPAKAAGYVPAYRPQPYLTPWQPPAKAGSAAKDATPAAASADYDRELARLIDHTLLKPESTADQVTKVCKEALEYQFASVCVNPTWAPLVANLLKGSPVKTCAVVGFPLGATSTTAKALEAADVIQKGATEVDMVLNVGALKSGERDMVRDDIKAVVEAARGKALVKVILETGLLTNEEKVTACELAKQAGADFVKTSTGFGAGGATVEDIALMRKTVGPNMGVKASGGIRDFETAQAMVKAGASRIGASASVSIVKRVKPQPAKDKY